MKVGDIVRISKYENISAKGYALNWSEEVIVIINVINDLNREEILGTFYEKELLK